MKKAICVLLSFFLLASCSPKEEAFFEENPGENCTLPDDVLVFIEEKEQQTEEKNNEDGVFLFPENEFEMTEEAFLERENDKYLCYIFGMTDCVRKSLTPEERAEYKGFSSAEEIESEALFNIFMYVFDEAKNSSKGDLSAARWLENDGSYHIPINDIENIIGKYFDEFEFDMENSGADFYYDENGAAVLTQGYGKNSDAPPEIISVERNEDGTLTARAGISVFKTDSLYGSYEQPIRDLSLVFRLEEERFVCIALEQISLS